MKYFKNIQADMARYEELGGWYINWGFWITLVYRFGYWGAHLRPRIIGVPLRILHKLLAIPFRISMHVYLPTQTTIGPGFCLPHPHLILIPPGTSIGANCTFYHDVTLGRGSIPGDPVLVDNVVVFSGAKILGGVIIGEHAHIGVNAIVTRNVKPAAVVSAPLCRSVSMAMMSGGAQRTEAA